MDLLFCPHSTGSISNKQQALPTPLFVLIRSRSAPYMCKSKTNGKDPKDYFCWVPKNGIGRCGTWRRESEAWGVLQMGKIHRKIRKDDFLKYIYGSV